MPATTYLDDASVRRGRSVPEDPECDDLLQELRRVSGEDWLVLVRTHPGKKTRMDRLLRQEAQPEVHYSLYADCHGEWQDINFVRPENSESRGPAGSREGVMNYMLGYTAGLHRARYVRSLEPSPPELSETDVRGMAELCVRAYQAGAKWEGSWGEAGPDPEHRMRLDDAELALIHVLPAYVRTLESRATDAEEMSAQALEDSDAVRDEMAKILDPEMKDLRLENGGINIAVAGPIVERMAMAVVGWFRESGAENYIEMNLNARDNPEEAYVVNVQKRGRKSPHQFRLDAEQELAELRSEVERLRSGASGL